MKPPILHVELCFLVCVSSGCAAPIHGCTGSIACMHLEPWKHPAKSVSHEGSSKVEPANGSRVPILPISAASYHMGTSSSGSNSVTIQAQPSLPHVCSYLLSFLLPATPLSSLCLPSYNPKYSYPRVQPRYFEKQKIMERSIWILPARFINTYMKVLW